MPFTLFPSYSFTSTIILFSSKSVTSGPTDRRPSRTSSSEQVPNWKVTTMPGLKRQASKEKPEPRDAKRIKTDYSVMLPPARSPWANTPSAVFVWGCGDDGSLGLGPDYLDEVPRPRQLCGDGIMSIAAGGMYTLLLSKNGKVSTSPVSHHPETQSLVRRLGPVATTTRALLDVRLNLPNTIWMLLVSVSTRSLAHPTWSLTSDPAKSQVYALEMNYLRLPPPPENCSYGVLSG